MKTVVLVESPHKAKTISRHLKDLLPGHVVVLATSGHLRDLPANTLGVDVQAGFAPQYVIRKPRSVDYLRPFIRQADRILLAMDADREGEAIAWHLTKIFAAELQGKSVQRVTFRALSRRGLKQGLQHPRPLDKKLVRAAIARRVIDRLIGYQVSPRLWAAMKKQNLGKDFGAGRVQIAALRILAEERQRWKIAIRWTR